MFDFKKEYGTYEEYHFRFAMWKEAINKINDLNSIPGQTATYAMNHFGDLTPEEFKLYYLGYKPNRKHNEAIKLDTSNLPDNVDWVTKGAVTPIKDQGGCGSCWAFAATGSLEGAYFLKGNTLTSFSEQQLVECSHAQGNEGCNGGFPSYAFVYLKDHYIETEDSYPYTGYDIKCNYDQSKGVTEVPEAISVAKETKQLQAAVAMAPIAIGVDAS